MRVIGQREQLVADARQQELAVATRQVEAADAACEKRVAGEYDALAEETDVAVGVSRAEQHLELQVAYL